MLDWQTAAVAFIILAALAYVSRRGWARLRSFTARGSNSASSCASGCGGCGTNREPQMIVRTSVESLVQIGRADSDLRPQRK
ncbi:MAG TPA: hypothetical protein VM866_07275 [Pyrinomonadaceae bacterium]|nr:hypothetical protein [Pyrinomonadaceae bacterium]